MNTIVLHSIDLNLLISAFYYCFNVCILVPEKYIDYNTKEFVWHMYIEIHWILSWNKKDQNAQLHSSKNKIDEKWKKTKIKNSVQEQKTLSIAIKKPGNRKKTQVFNDVWNLYETIDK